MADAGIKDILVPYNILGQTKFERLVELSRRARLSVTADSEVVVSGLSGAARQAGWNRPMIGKTGTAQDHKASTFVGATPFMSGAAMIFQPDGNAQPLCVGGPARPDGGPPERVRPSVVRGRPTGSPTGTSATVMSRRQSTGSHTAGDEQGATVERAWRAPAGGNRSSE